MRPCILLLLLFLVMGALSPTAALAQNQANPLEPIATRIGTEVRTVGSTFATIVGSILGLTGAVLAVMAFFQAFMHGNLGRGGWYGMGALLSFAVAGIVTVFTGTGT